MRIRHQHRDWIALTLSCFFRYLRTKVVFSKALVVLRFWAVSGVSNSLAYQFQSMFLLALIRLDAIDRTSSRPGTYNKSDARQVSQCS